jgi:outer membrane protein OmpA-like peptidoglycan-associated protein
MSLSRPILTSAIALCMIAGCASNIDPNSRGGVYPVFFEEFSADISPDAQAIIDTAAAEAKHRHTTLIRVEARANATGSPDATMKIAETRAAVIRDALLRDGVAGSSIRLIPLGQMGTTDTGVMPRRVTITLEN